MSALFRVRFWTAAVVFFAAALYAACVSPQVPSKANTAVSGQPTASPRPQEAASPSRQAWETEWDKTLKEAKKERQVVILGGFGAALAREPFIRAMKEQFGLEADITIAPGPVLIQKIVSERRAGIFRNDVYLGGTISIVGEIFPRKLLQPIEPNLILPEVKDPALWFRGELPAWGPEREALFAIMNTASFAAINNTLFRPQEISSYDDLLKPRMKGLMVMTDPTVAGAGRSWFTMTYRIMGPNYLKEFIKQEPVLTRDLRQITDWIITGKYPVGIGLDTSPISSAMRDGFPVAILPIFKEGAVIGAGPGHVTMFNDTPHPNAAKIFVNWLLSKEGMTTFSKAIGMASRRVDVPTDHLDAAMVPDPKIKYVFESQKLIEEDIKLQPIAMEIFGPLLGR